MPQTHQKLLSHLQEVAMQYIMYHETDLLLS